MVKKKYLLYSLLVALVLLTIAVLSGYWYLDRFSKTILHAKTHNQIFTLKRGTSIHQLALQMEQEFTLSDAKLLPYFVRLHPSLRHIKAGSYQIPDAMTVEEFLQLLNHGKEMQFSIKFIEGKRAEDWLALLQETENVNSSLIDHSTEEVAKKLGLEQPLEGWLYPDTYYYASHTSDLTLLKRAYQKMKNTLDMVWVNRDENLPYKTPYELLIMASIIEKETAVDAERGKVASVFVNRLRYNMKLQTDPTVIYGMGSDYQGQILRKHLQDENNPFNTYVINGLPPTPIAMPSLASLEAAAHPEKTNYLYFVADGSGGHTFSKNYKDHQAAVKKYWKLMRECKNNTK